MFEIKFQEKDISNDNLDIFEMNSSPFKTINLIEVRVCTPFDLSVIKLCIKDGNVKHTHDIKSLFRHFKSYWVSSDKSQLKPV